MRTLVDLALTPEHRRGHGSLYGALNRGRMDVERLRTALAGLPLPAPPTAAWCSQSTSRRGCGRTRRPARTAPSVTPSAAATPSIQMIPGWPYSFVVAPETGRTSWTAVLDAVRLEPGADVAAVTAANSATWWSG
ncbi:transposase [Streptomyces sp. NBC_01438]|uniref:transposase n=1 Tax=Streptomyces sp. NBC_01438 TaxID=2903866 RepID=UPI00324F0CD3